nr:MFS transporter [Actinomadura sp. CNU-125]
MNDAPPSTTVIRNAGDVAGLIDTLKALRGRTNWIWFLALAGLFLDAYSNAALGAGLSTMVDQLELSPTQVSVLTAMAPAIAIVSNPFGGWLAARIGRLKPLLLTKVVFGVGAVLTAVGSDFLTVFAGRGLVGIATASTSPSRWPCSPSTPRPSSRDASTSGRASGTPRRPRTSR